LRRWHTGLRHACCWAAGCGGSRSRQRRLVQLASDLVLDDLEVGLLVRVDARVAGHPEKRLTVTLRIHDFLARANDAERALCGGLVGLPLMVSDDLGDFTDLDRELVFRLQFIIDLFIAIVGYAGEFVAKLLHAVEGILQCFFVGTVFFRDLSGLVGAFTKRIPDSVGGLALLPSQGCRDGLLQCVVKLREIRLNCSAISNGIIESGHRCDADPLRANQQCRPLTGRIIRHRHVHNCRTVLAAALLASTTGFSSGSEVPSPSS
jgi:hypothetical protein